MSFAELENAILNFSHYIGHEILQKVVNKKSKNNRPKHIIFPKTEKLKKKL